MSTGAHGPCVDCGAPDAARIADLAVGHPLHVCEACLAGWATDAGVDHLRRSGSDEATVERFRRLAGEGSSPDRM